MEMQKEYLRSKLTEIGSAIFHNVSDEPKLISSSIISAVRCDDDGRVYFFAARPPVLLEEDLRFPAVLDFYKKGKPYFIKLNGIAELLTDDTTICAYSSRLFSSIDPAGRSNVALVRFNVEKVEYSGRLYKLPGLWKKLISALYSSL